MMMNKTALVILVVAVAGVSAATRSPNWTSFARVEVVVGNHNSANTNNDIYVWCKDGDDWVARWGFTKAERGDSLLANDPIVGQCSTIAVCKGGTDGLQINRVRLLSPSNTAFDNWETDKWLDTTGATGCLYYYQSTSVVGADAAVCNGGSTWC